MYLKDVFKYKNHQHCILYVRSPSFDIFKYLNIDNYEIKYHPIEYKYYKNSYFFDNNEVTKNLDTYKQYINELINTCIINDHIYIYIYNFNEPNKYFQLYIKHIMEHNINSKIILVTQKLPSINNSIRYQCLIITHKTIESDIMYKQEWTIVNILYDIYIKNDFINFKNKIKLFVYHLFKNEIIIDTLINRFIDIITSKPYLTIKVKKEIIENVSNINHKISKSYNKIILYEYIFIQIYILIKPSIDIYYNL